MDPDPLAGSTGNAPRKVKFKPKAPPKRVKKEVLPKAEKEEDDIDEAKAEHLLRRFHETSSGRPKTEKKVTLAQVAFGIGGSSGNIKSYRPANDASSGFAKVAKEYKEPWDYYTYYPVTLPVRRPYAGNPELLDMEEFGEDQERPESEELATNAAQELGLLDEGQENNMFFLQLPRMLPTIAHSSDSKVPEPKSTNPLKGRDKSQNPCKLDSLQEGLIGKMLVYKSGAVKLKIGDAIYDLFAGICRTEVYVCSRCCCHQCGEETLLQLWGTDQAGSRIPRHRQHARNYG
ncbi:uncharacterized protein LOC131005647 isoform X1 [Salvia miltiorrhiza]|uniref:uncharacterized protein LOC131005647 isoform X1 n=1 Tax=Salvia miltiorrhiza TaxID=226208 RepID=UPI0025AD8735|nr:uncharacterized protein LOC131005647 isoform X1 [Salvia miltiorrhiza]